MTVAGGRAEGYAAVGLLGLIWGSVFELNAYALTDLSPRTSTFARLAVAWIALSAAARLTPAPPDGAPPGGRMVALGALWYAVPFLLVLEAQTRIAPPTAAALNATLPFVVLGLSWRRVARPGSAVLGAAVGLTGVLAITRPWGVAASSRTGILLMIGAVVSYALGNLLAQRSNETGSLRLARNATGWGALLALPVAALAGAPSDVGSSSVAAVLALGLGSGALGGFLLSFLARRSAVSAAAPTLLLPAVAVFLHAIVTGEAPRTLDYLALVCVAAGSWIVLATTYPSETS